MKASCIGSRSRALALGVALAASAAGLGTGSRGRADEGRAASGAAGSAPEADLATTLVDLVDPIVAGGVQIYEIAVANHGPGRATGVTLQHELPPGGHFLGGEPASMGCRLVAERLVECGLGSIAAGATAGVRIGVLIDHRVDGQVSSEALVAGDEPDPDAANDGAEAATEVVPVRELVVADRGGERALAIVVKEGRGTVSLVFADPTGGDRESSVELPGFRAVALAELPSFAATSSTEVAALAAGFEGATRVAVVDAGSRKLLGDHEVAGDWLALDVVALGSFADTAAAELALLLRDRQGGELRLRVLDAASGLVVRDHPVAGSTGGAPFAVGMASLPSFDGAPGAELAILTRSPETGETRLLVVDAASGTVLRSHERGAGLFPLAIVALSDLGLAGGTRAADVALLVRHASTRDLHVQVLDADNGAQLGRIDLDDALLPNGLVAVPNLGGGPADEVAVLGRVHPDTLMVSVRDAATGATVSSIALGSQPRAPVPLGLATIPGQGDESAPALAVLFELQGEPAQVRLFDALNGRQLARFSLP